MSANRESNVPGGILVVGLALLALGVATESRFQQQPPITPPPQLLSTPSYATSDSNGTMIAVTGIDVTGSSILYLIDTERRNLAVYQAQGGTSSTQSVRLIGARNIDLDLLLDGYNDNSEYSYKELQKEFDRLPSDD